MATHFHKLFLGHQPYNMVKILRRFRDYLCPHHLSYHNPDDRDGPWNVGEFKPSDMADGPRRFR
jgi:hypothetical protein